MQLYTRIDPLKQAIAEYKGKKQTTAFIPTMGALHLGHIALVRKAREIADIVVVSIFVNPAQFDQRADLDLYPRDLKSDLDALQPEKVDIVFAPHEEELYPEDFKDWVEPGNLAAPLEGEKRPGHFRGVTTVVNLLFQIITPDFAVFGEKDFQQVRVIEQMTQQRKLPVKIVRVPTVREDKGLALSSRNARLTAEEHDAAQLIAEGLRSAQKEFLAGEQSPSKLADAAKRCISRSKLVQVEYLEIVDEVTMRPVDTAVAGTRLMVAAKVGGVRLIDNAAL